MSIIALRFLAQQNTTVQVGNSSVVSESMRDNPLMHHYAGVYTMSMGIMLLLKLLRGTVFVKVRFYIFTCSWFYSIYTKLSEGEVHVSFGSSSFFRVLCVPPQSSMTNFSRRFFVVPWNFLTQRPRLASSTDSPKIWMKVRTVGGLECLIILKWGVRNWPKITSLYFLGF